MSTYIKAMAEAIRISGMDDRDLAAKVGVSPGYFSRLTRKSGAVWAGRVVALCKATGSDAPVRWMAAQLGCDLVQRDSRAAEVAALKQRLQDLERAA